MTTCKSWMKYSREGAYCENAQMEGDPEGLCILHSLKPEKDKTAFDQALQDKLAREDYDFREVFFPGPVSFIGHKFNKPVNFHGARFSGWANFREAEFSDLADFSRAKFSQAAIFEKAKFSGPAFFKATEIIGEADFRGVTFDHQAVFQQISGQPGIEDKGFSSAYFQYLNFGPWGRLRFQDLSLVRASFLGTDMRRLDFHHISWHPYRGRQALYDEVLLAEKRGPHFISLISRPEQKLDYEGLCAAVEELYRYLKLVYEKEGDLKQAGDFHYGEMEMHRRGDPWRRWCPFCWYNLYCLLNGYGERPLRALACLLGILGGMGFFLSLSGLKTPEGAGVGFGSALIYLLQQATLIHPDWAAPASPAGNLLGALSRLMLPGQLALFILALRNRLGRRR